MTAPKRSENQHRDLYQNLGYLFGWSGLTAGIVIVVAFVIAMIVLAVNNSNTNKANAYNETVVAWNEQSLEERQSEVEEIQTAKKYAVWFNVSSPNFGLAGVADEDYLVAERELPGPFNWRLLWIVLGIIAAAWWTTHAFLLAIFGDESEITSQSGSLMLADLQWHKPWVWLAVIGLGPLCWVCMLVNFMWFMVKNRAWPGKMRREFMKTVRKPANAKSNAATQYAKLVGKQGGRDIAQEKTATTNMVTFCEQELAKLGTEVQGAQRRLADAKQQRQLLDQPARNRTTDEAKDDFQSILATNGVTNVAVKNGNGLQVDVVIVREYNGRKYYMGDWRINLVRRARDWSMKCERTKIEFRSDHRGNDYRYNDGTYGFCFGNRRSQVEYLLSTGQIPALITLVIDSISSINNMSEIPQVFKEVTE